jgi:hypothetical protein
MADQAPQATLNGAANCRRMVVLYGVVADRGHGSFLPSRIPAGIPDSIGFQNKLILPWNGLIPMCVPRNSADSAGKNEFRKMRPGRNRNRKRNARPSL